MLHYLHYLTLSIQPTRSVWSLAWVLTLVIKATKVVRTLCVIEALSSPTGHQSVTRVSPPGGHSWLLGTTMVISYGQVQTGLAFPDLSDPSLHCAPSPQGLGSHKDWPPDPPPDLQVLHPWVLLDPLPGDLRHLPPTLGSPSVPGGQEHSALWSTPLQLAVGLQHRPPPQNVGLQGSRHRHIVVGESYHSYPYQHRLSHSKPCY